MNKREIESLQERLEKHKNKKAQAEGVLESIETELVKKYGFDPEKDILDQAEDRLESLEGEKSEIKKELQELETALEKLIPEEWK